MRKYTIVPCIDPDTSKIGFCYPDGSVKIKGSYRNARYFSEGLAVVEGESGYGLIDSNGKVLYDTDSQQILDKHNGFLFISGKDGKHLVYEDKNIPVNIKLSQGFRIFDLKRFSSNIIRIETRRDDVGKDTRFILLGSDGNKIGEYQFVGKLGNGFAYVGNYDLKGKTKVAFMNDKGKLITPLKYDDVKNFSEGIAAAKLNNKWGAIDASGKEVIPFIYDRMDDFSEGVASACKNEKCGYIDKNGNKFIGFKYKHTGKFSKGLAVVCPGDTCGYMDKLGNFVIKPKYEDAFSFDKGIAAAELSGKYGVIDKSGKLIIDNKYDGVKIYDEYVVASKILK